MALRANGIAFVMEPTHGEDAARTVLEAGHPVDAIVYDVDNALHTPAIMELARHHSPPVPVIIVATAIPQHRTLAYLRAGAADVVSKELLSRLPEALRKAVDHVAVPGAKRKAVRTRRKDLEEKLLAQEQRIHFLFHHNPQAMWIHDAQTLHIVDANDAALRQYGTTRAQMLSRTLADMVPTEDVAAFEQAVKAAPGSADAGAWRHVRQDGSIIDVEVAQSELFHEGSPCRLVVARDVTEARRARAEMKVAAEEWRQTIDAIDRAILVVDGKDEIRRLNRSALELGGWQSYLDAIGRRIEDLMDLPVFRTVSVLSKAARTSGSPATTEVRDASRIWVVRASPMERPDRDSWIVLVLSDMTHEVGLLERGRGLAGVGALVQGIAHDVRNPIHFMGLAAESLDERFGKTEEIAPYVRVFQAHLAQLTSLMRDLLDYGRTRHADFSQFYEISDITEEAVTRCRAVAHQAGITISFRPESRLAPVAVAREEIVRAIQNLLENAVQHSPKGSDVEVSVREIEDEPGGAVECSVRDRGRGIAPEDSPRVFEPFFTSRPGGTGLGLALTARIVSEHGGRVMVTNHAEGGAIFTIRLPRR